MFKKLKDKIEEEFKQAPIKFPVSVQQLAQVISPSQSVNSLSDNNATNSSSLMYPADMSNVSTDFFSIAGDDDPQDGVTKMPLTLHNVDLTASSPSNMTHSMSRSRRSSLSSVTSETSSLFPIFESGLNQNFFQSDLESEMEDGISGQIEKLSRDQLHESFKKILNRYSKYKGKYTELMKHYKELQHDNFKTKNVLQESQDKALRRMAELREQCQLEQKAKAHLEESLRNDVEERDHIIDTLKTKIFLLSNGSENAQLINLEADEVGTKMENGSQSKELWHLKSQNEDLQREIERLKKIKETACSFINRCDTTINEATEDVKSDDIKQKMSELKSEIQKMKSENESLSHLLSRNLITEEDKKCQTSAENSLSTDLSNLESSQGDQKVDEKDKKIEKLNNLLLKCKEKINSLSAEIKAKNLIIEDNNKRLKELGDEVAACKVREQENALSVAENKKAIHEELHGKEEQIKALTKELKTKENEFIKEKAEVVKNYEDKIRDMTADFAKEMKLKNEQNQKLQEDLKAKEIISGSLDKIKFMEESFVSMLEFVKTRSSAFEELAKLKTQEIEKAQCKLEEKMTAARKNLNNLLQNAKQAKVGQLDLTTQEKIPELQAEFKNPNIEASENFHIVEKLKSDVINLSKKLEILELDLEDSRKECESEREEKDKWREKYSLVEAECNKTKKEFEKKLNENTELGKALNDRNEKIKEVESEKKLLQKVSNEKVETESKLKEYIQNYNKLEKENRTMQNDLVERCGKLMKELNESKEKIKNLENQGKEKAIELKRVIQEYSESEKTRSVESERLKSELETLKEELQASREKVEKINSDSKQVDTLMKEAERTKAELVEKNKRIEELEAELRQKNEEAEEIQKELNNLRKEMLQEKRLLEAAKNELEALRNNLKSELKEKDEKSILVDKLTKECNLLLAEIENLKKTHAKVEKKLAGDFENVRKEVLDKTNTIEKLEQALAETEKEKNEKTSESDELKKKCESFTAELESLKLEQNTLLEEKSLSVSSEKLRHDLADYEKSTQELNDKIAELTNDKNDMYGELQIKINEVETLKSSLVALRNEMSEKTKAFEEEKVQLVLENENKLNVLKNEIKFIYAKHEEDIGNFEENLNSEMKEVNEKMEIAEKTSAELLEKLEKITSERDELKLAEEEKNLKISELENCMKALKMELDEKFNNDERKAEEGERHKEKIKNINTQHDKKIVEMDEEIAALKLKLSVLEDEERDSRHREEVKQIIIEYDKEVGKRDDEIESLKSKISGYDDALERLKNAKEEIKNLKKELGEKDTSLEEKLEEIERLKKDGEKAAENENEERESLRNLKMQLEKQKSENERIKIENNLRLEEEKRSWESKMAALHEKHEKETLQWNSEKKTLNTDKSEVIADDRNTEDGELECTSKVAVAALESGSGSIELLQKQLIQQTAAIKELKRRHKREIIELKKMSGKRNAKRNSEENQYWLLGSDNIDNDTEHEFLRNILYEYMMGKEQLVLAKVLSAIVEFNEEQTHNVLEKEQRRQTLLGQLGLI